MTRKEFLEQIGISAIAIPCFGILTGCEQNVTPNAPTNVDFTLDVSSGALSSNGGYLVKDGILVARTFSGNFLAVSSYCTHQGTTVQYVSSQNDFYCPNHGARYSSTGSVLQGPASKPLKQYNTELIGNSLRVYS